MRRTTTWSWTSVLVALAMTIASLVSSAAPAHAAVVNGSFTPLTPTRVLDTRGGSVPAAGSTANVVVAGRGGVPAGASAVVLNVTAVGPSSGGFLTVCPKGSTRPTASNLNFSAGQTIANQVVATVGTSGSVSLYTSARTHLLVDVAGYFPDRSTYDALTPSRLLDTRTGSRPAAGSTTPVRLTGRSGVPTAGVAAVVLNVTAVAPASNGWLTAYPTGTAAPTASNVNYEKRQNIAGLVFATVGKAGSFDVYTSGSADILVDVLGWIPTGSSYRPIGAQRPLDTRSASPVAAGAVTRLPLLGHAGIPASGVSAVELNVTAAQPTTAGFLTVYPGGTRPTASNLNVQASRTVANSVTAKVSADGSVSIYSSATTHLVVDVVGFTVERGAPTWGTPSRVMQPGSSITSVSCASTTLCAAVDRNGSLAVSTGATPWLGTIVDTEASWTSVSCSADAQCMAVGTRPIAQSGTEAVATTYNGSTWSQPAVVVRHGALSGISCPTTTFCTATGRDTASGRGISTRFDGTTWSTPSSTGGAPLTAVSCPSSDFCAAGASDGNIATWNGATWAYQPGVSDTVDSVSCVSATFCMASGSSIATFDGTGWATISGPAIFDPRVSCATSSRCRVVGLYGATSTYHNGTFSGVEYLDPVTGGPSYTMMTGVSCPEVDYCAIADNNTLGSVVWTLSIGARSSRTIVTPSQGALRSVSCPLVTFCAIDDGIGHVQTMTPNGGWTVPLRLGPWSAGLSCSTAGSCVVANDLDGKALIFADGAWSRSPTGTTSTDVSCTAATFCMSIDMNGSSRFNGVRWTLPVRFPNDLSGSRISCVGATYCVGIVHRSPSGGASAIIWNGSSWSAPVLITQTAPIYALSCSAVGQCIAMDRQGNSYALTTTGWSSPTHVTDAGLTGVSCPTTRWCMAVDQVGGTYEWDGATWSTAGVVPGDDTTLAAISCPAVRRCTAVGAGALVRTFG